MKLSEKQWEAILKSEVKVLQQPEKKSVRDAIYNQCEGNISKDELLTILSEQVEVTEK